MPNKFSRFSFQFFLQDNFVFVMDILWHFVLSVELTIRLKGIENRCVFVFIILTNLYIYIYISTCIKALLTANKKFISYSLWIRSSSISIHLLEPLFYSSSAAVITRITLAFTSHIFSFFFSPCYFSSFSYLRFLSLDHQC